MEIASVTIIVRGKAGQVKKAVFTPGCQPSGSPDECLEALESVGAVESSEPAPAPAPPAPAPEPKAAPEPAAAPSQPKKL